jgi:hypothetical protein
MLTLCEKSTSSTINTKWTVVADSSEPYTQKMPPKCWRYVISQSTKGRREQQMLTRKKVYIHVYAHVRITGTQNSCKEIYTAYNY